MKGEQINKIAEKIKKDVLEMLKDYEKTNKNEINLDNETLEKLADRFYTCGCCNEIKVKEYGYFILKPKPNKIFLICPLCYDKLVDGASYVEGELPN